MGKARKLIFCVGLHIALLKIVAVLGHKAMNGDTLLYIKLHIRCSDIPCSIGSVRDLFLIRVCCITTFCSSIFPPLCCWLDFFVVLRFLGWFW